VTIRERLNRLELMHPAPVDVDAWARDRAELLMEMDDATIGPRPRDPVAFEALVAELIAMRRNHDEIG